MTAPVGFWVALILASGAAKAMGAGRRKIAAEVSVIRHCFGRLVYGVPRRFAGRQDRCPNPHMAAGPVRARRQKWLKTPSQQGASQKWHGQGDGCNTPCKPAG